MKQNNLIFTFAFFLLLSPICVNCNDARSLNFSVSFAKAANNSGISSAVINNKTGKYRSGKKSNIKRPVASLTKLMTALVLLDENINFNSYTTIKQSDLDHVYSYVARGTITSAVSFRVGDRVKLNDLWSAMLVASSNEAAAALVRATGFSKSNFADKMNAKAKALGLKKTKFTESSGIDVKNVSTAQEMAKIARKAFDKKKIRTTSKRKSCQIKVSNTGRVIGVTNRNGSLLRMKSEGFKIGYLTEAKNNVAIRLKNGSKRGIIVVLHANTTGQRNNEINRLKKKL